MNYALLPMPEKIEYQQGTCVLTPGLRVSGCKQAIDRLQTALHEMPTENGLCPIELQITEGSFPEEAYRLRVQEDGAYIEASSFSGLFYGLQTLGQMLQQSQDHLLSCVQIEDKSHVRMRATIIDLRFQSFKMDYLLDQVRQWASMKLNCVHIDYADRFPYDGKYEVIRGKSAFTHKEIDQFVQCCRDHFIDLVPIVQSFGHMEYILNHKEFEGLVENFEGGNPFRSQCCPLNDESFIANRDLLTQIYNAHKPIKYLSIGGDETFHLGKCPKCAQYAKEHGKGFLYLQHINKLIDFVCSLGATPICYADIVLAYPETVPYLDKRAIIGDWDYDTGDGVYDKFHDWSTKDSVHISQVDSLSEPFASILREHCIMPDGKHFYPFGYVKYLKELGFEVIGHCSSCAVGPDDLWTPNYTHHIPNVHGYISAIERYGALGIVNTCWEQFLFETPAYGLAFGAEAMWRGGENMAQDIEQRFAAVYYGIADKTIVEAMYRLSMPFTMTEKRWPKVMIPGTGRRELPLAQIYENKELLENIQFSMQTFEAFLPRVKYHRFSLMEWLYGAKIKLFWLDMARVYDRAMHFPEDEYGRETDLLALEKRALELKRETLSLHNWNMPMEWILIRFNKAFEKIEILSKELRERDYRMGTDRR